MNINGKSPIMEGGSFSIHRSRSGDAKILLSILFTGQSI